MTKASTLLSFPKSTKQSTGELRAPQKGNKMKEILKWAGEFITCLLFMGTLAGITWFVLVVYG